MTPETISVDPGPQPPNSHHLSSSGHHDGSRRAAGTRRRRARSARRRRRWTSGCAARSSRCRPPRRRAGFLTGSTPALGPLVLGGQQRHPGEEREQTWPGQARAPRCRRARGSSPGLRPTTRLAVLFTTIPILRSAGQVAGCPHATRRGEVPAAGSVSRPRPTRPRRGCRDAAPRAAPWPVVRRSAGRPAPAA